MWLLFHHEGKTRAVPGGRTFTEKCPTCMRRTRFQEVEVTEGFGLWFVNLVKDRERAFRCGSCGEVFDLRDSDPAAAGASQDAEDLAATRAVEREAERRRRAESQAARELRIEDELAELKRRLGR